ncbi:NAD(P)H-binding protein [Alkalisalibacterium limincola]|nr:NAD(P)H-binding protein [Alkalisalibacterium limincola]
MDRLGGVAEKERHAAGPMRVLVLGGSGFIGRHASAALQAAGCDVVVGTRDPAKARRKLLSPSPQCAFRRVRLERHLDPRSWEAVLEGVDAVVNCVGILRQRGRETYDRVHHLAPAALAAACAEGGIRLVHVSALGLRAPVRSRFLHSKRDGEDAIRACGGDWCIVRPSLLDGRGGFGARWIRRVAGWPVHALPANATGRIAALDVCDLGEALARLVVGPRMDGPSREFELGGLQERSIGEQLRAMSPRTRPPLGVKVPVWLARLASHVCDLLHVTPYSFGHYELLRFDNCPRPNRLPEVLGRLPRPVPAAEGGIIRFTSSQSKEPACRLSRHCPPTMTPKSLSWRSSSTKRSASAPTAC